MGKLSIRFLTGIFLVSVATLCLEISLIRYFSIAQHYHFAFWVVSIAFLGYGASGSFLTVFKGVIKLKKDQFLSLSSLLFSISIFFSFLLCNAISFDFIKLSWERNHIFTIFLYYFILSIPFLFAGMTISFAITKCSEHVNKIYFADLLGAGIGTLLTLFVFLPKGDRGAIILISFFPLLSSLLFGKRQPFYFKGVLFLIMAAGMGLLLASPSWLSFRISSFKALPLALHYPQSNLILTKWSAISRIDILDSPAVRFAPGLSLLYDKNLPPQLGLSIDGGELNAVTSFHDPKDPALMFLSSLPSSLAYSLVQKPRVLIADPRGGLDVLQAFIKEASQIKVIESQPLIADILRKELAFFSGNLYLKKNIHVLTSNCRTALKTEKQNYDLIVLSLTDVFGSSATGIYGFGEKYLYTLEAFDDMLNRLTPDGIVSISLYLLPPPRQEIRMLATWIEALERKEKNPSTHIMAIRSWGTISYFIKKSPFHEEDIQKLKDHCEKFLFDLVYYPGIKPEETNVYNKFEEPIYYNLALQLLSPIQRANFTNNYLFDVKPVSDNRPFFYNFFKSSKTRATYRAFGHKWLPFLQEKFLVPLLLIQSVILAFILIFLPTIVSKKRNDEKKVFFSNVFFYFSLIGMAFIFVEITFIQKFILFLGHPLYSVSVIIFSLLFSSSLGSYFSGKILGKQIKKKLKICLCINTGLISASLFFFPVFNNTFLGFILPVKILLTFLFFFPLGFFMGFPFPSGIRLLSAVEKNMIPWAWAANAFSTVVNSVMALMLAFWGGYNFVLILAAAGYLSTVLFLRFNKKQQRMPSSV